PLVGAPSCDTRFGAFCTTWAYNAAGVSVLRRWRGTLACLYSWSASQVVQRVCLTSSPIIASLARTVIVQNVTKPKLALLHQRSRNYRWQGMNCERWPILAELAPARPAI